MGAREFLDARYAGVRLVFSTYQSAHVVAAGMQPGAAFGFALSDKNLAIKKRLFLTSTPRHYDLRRRDRVIISVVTSGMVNDHPPAPRRSPRAGRYRPGATRRPAEILRLASRQAG